ncbi:thioredoxin H2-like [Olea europaea var. sylvestris]|uniref:thioredoxin H2-like n=1 Tax=Olea europaea var. sylvestris TaxID=158386 RepID=UPI000C1D5EAF|nr:thioredoxin H2-like [Olea europaea var. sylvestris]
MGANFSTEYEATGPAMNKGLIVPSSGSSANTGRGIVSDGSSANTSRDIVSNESSVNKGRVIAYHSSSKWKIHFEASKLTSNLMVIDFTASWCGPCRYMEPAMNEFATKYTDVEFIKIDIDELEDVAQEFEVHVLPTFLLIKKGKEVDKLVGANKEELGKKIEKHRV